MEVCSKWCYYRGFLKLVKGNITNRSMAMNASIMTNDLIPYELPASSKGLKNSPTCRIKLAQLPTPIHKWNIPGVPSDFEVFIKRDDMTGSTLSGNKVRKLEFLMADALQKGCKHVITCGGLQSNHCRAMAIACAQLGLKTHLVLRTDLEKASEVNCSGNLLLNRLCGASMYLVPKVASEKTELLPRMKKIAENIKKETGEDSYIIPVGGSNSIGLHGYLEAFGELISQNVEKDFDDLIFACGSGSTAEGLAIGNYINKTNLKVHAVAVCDDAKYFHQHTNEMLKEVGLTDVKGEDILEVIEGHKGKGYGISRQEELDFILDVAKSTGIMLDPVYTGKAARGMVLELQNNPSRFKGKRILYIHTGGVFGMYDGRLDQPLLENTDSSQIFSWKQLENVPF